MMKGEAFMDKKKIDRISELTKISKERELTLEEKEEREALRLEYRKAFAQSLSGQLENITILEPDGTKIPVKDLKKN